MSARPQLLLVVGPNASGKTALAIALAERLGGEIVSADSQQVYRGMDIGTGKASAAERARVPHHLIDLIEPDQQMSAMRWADAADEVISAIAARGKRPIVCGGTGLYVRALTRGLFAGVGRNDEVRAALAAEAAERGTVALHARLAAADPESAARIHPTDELRLTRALEVLAVTGKPLSAHHAEHGGGAPRYPTRGIGLNPPPAVRAARIDARVEQMMAAGLLGEVRALVERGLGEAPALAAIGYRQLVQHLSGQRSLEEAVALIKRDSRRYARRQLGWYRSPAGQHDLGLAWYEDASLVPVEEPAKDNS